MRAGRLIPCGLLGLALGLALASAGCRWHPPLDLQPTKEPETCCEPPREPRYDRPNYPKEALKSDDAIRKPRDLLDPNNPITPVRGPMGAGGPGTMPGGRPY